MVNLKDCIELGTTTKTHGVQGQLVLKLNHLSFDDIIEMESVFILIDGLPVPFFIEEFSERMPDSIILKLEDVDSKDDARKLTNMQVYTDKKNLTNEQVSKFNHINQFIGYKVIDQKQGIIGYLESVIQNIDNPLFYIRRGTQEIFLPLQEEFIIDVIEDKQEIIVSCPEGLLNLYE